MIFIPMSVAPHLKTRFFDPIKKTVEYRQNSSNLQSETINPNSQLPDYKY